MGQNTAGQPLVLRVTDSQSWYVASWGIFPKLQSGYIMEDFFYYSYHIIFVAQTFIKDATEMLMIITPKKVINRSPRLT